MGGCAKESGRKDNKVEIGKLITGKNFVITDRTHIARTINHHLCNITKKLNLNPHPSDSAKFCQRSIKPENVLTSFQLTTEREVSMVIGSLEPKKSAGWDEVSPYLLKRCSSILVQPLTALINKSLQQGVFPDLLKPSIVKAIPKKGNVHTLDNLRPISLLSVYSKVFERIVFVRVYDFLESNNLLSNFQFGFRRGRSTGDAIFEFVDRVMAAVDGSRFTVGAFCDLSKAFDSVDFEILTGKLRCLGIAGGALEWLRSFLTGRVQRVVINPNHQSGFSKVVSGVPQGSILGPLLFLVYCNDLPDLTSQVQILMYADDTSIVASDLNRVNLSNTLVDTLENLDEWCMVNGLKLNPSKTQFVNFHVNYKNAPQSDSSYLPPGFNSVSSTKFLGLEIDATFSWCQQVDSLLPRLSKAFYALLALSSSVEFKVLRQVYFAYFHSLISYGLLFWGNSAEALRVFRMQKRVIRLFAGIKSRETCKNHFRKFQILPLPSLFIFQCLLYVKSNLSKFSSKNHKHNYSTRNSSILQYPIHRTTFFEKSPSYICMRIYNSCPTHIKSESSFDGFKILAKNYLLEKCFYSVPEYLSTSSSSV